MVVVDLEGIDELVLTQILTEDVRLRHNMLPLTVLFHKLDQLARFNMLHNSEENWVKARRVLLRAWLSIVDNHGALEVLSIYSDAVSLVQVVWVRDYEYKLLWVLAESDV